MKQLFRNALFVSMLAGLFTVACKKDNSCEACTGNNQPPLAVAGPDAVINLPTDSLLLDGSGSSDPNGGISEWQWSKVAGPTSSAIVNAASAKTMVKNLAAGIYQFALKVTDAGGLMDMDTVQITVNPAFSLNIEWQKMIGGTRVDVAQNIHPTADGGYIVAGNTNSQDGDITGYHLGTSGCYLDCFSRTYCDYFPDGLVVKLNSNGAIQWQKALGGSSAENLLSIKPTADGGYIASGLTYSNDGDVSGYHGGQDVWIVKLNNDGTFHWQKSLGGTANDFVNSIQRTTDGGYIVAGQAISNTGDVSGNHGATDAWVVKLKQ